MRPLLIAAGAIVSIAAACSGPDFQSNPNGNAGSSGSGSSSGGSNSGKGSGGSTSMGGSGPSSGGTGVIGTTGGSVNPGTGGTQGVAGDMTVPPACTDSSQCPSSGPCMVAYCDPSLGCLEEPVVDGPLTDDVPGDCRYVGCESGLETLIDDPNDFDDLNECTTDSCSAAGLDGVHVARPGNHCTGGICDYEGICRQCNVDACPASTDCMMPMCGNDGCQLAPKPRGTLCANQSNQCDGEGNCVDCTDNGGCEECCVCSNNVCVDA